MSSEGVPRGAPVAQAIKVGDRAERLHWFWQLAALLAAAVVVFSRQPDALLHPQFYGEDGHVWFADAYNRGWLAALFRIQDGYLQTLPRLAAALAMIAPLRYAPLIMNSVGFLIQLLPVPILLSGRLCRWGSLPYRVALAMVYVALPNTREVNVTVTEAQWHLALAASLLILSEPPRSKPGGAFDFVVFFICGLTGPFCILLVLLALTFWRLRSHNWTLIAALVFATAAAVQLHALAEGGAARASTLPLGAGIMPFLRILGGQVYAAAILGSNTLASIGGMAFIVPIVMTGTMMLLYACGRSTKEFQLLTCLAMLLFVASLASPMIGPVGSATTAWEFLAGRPAIHYWFFPTLVVSWGVVSLLLGPRRTQNSQILGLVLGLAMILGVMHDWRYVSFPFKDFASYAEKVQAASRGETIVIPETPPGWQLQLTKR